MKYLFFLGGLLYVFGLNALPVVAQQSTGDRILSETTDQAELDTLFETYFADSLEAEGAQTSPEAAQEAASCFDHYRFNSVETTVVPQTQSVSASTPINFEVMLTNTNEYPIIDGTLYVKIFRVDTTEKNAHGPSVVDQFIAQENLTLAANEKKQVVFDWQVPAWALGGEYRVATFFVSGSKFNLLGLSFTDDVVGSTAPFTVLSEHATGVFFDKTNVLINDEPYMFAAFPPRFLSGEPITLRATIVNTTDEPVQVPVQWRTFYWDSFALQDPVEQNVVVVEIPAESTKEVSFTSTDTAYPVYLGELTVQYQDAKSILNPRFVRVDAPRLRLNMTAVKQYPLQEGVPVELFACMHNTVDGLVDGRVVLRVQDMEGVLVHEYEYQGVVGGDIIGILDSFVPSQTLTNFVVTADLYQNDQLVESVSLEYACSDIATCSSEDVVKTADHAWWYQWPVYTLLTLLALGVLAFFIRQSMRKRIIG